ncbi:MAG: glycosyltransferase [Spirochaetes bacterium]|nr:glycosyltransferase [Spirochaetota bacterium]MBN2769940.1 glycosyltransferase [Spirochaetota bacterium]
MESDNSLQKLFSIIITYYNKEYEIALLLKALSLLDFESSLFEIIIIDDGSDKRIDEIIKQYSSSLAITYHYHANSKLRSRNRNIGASKAVGERLVFLDSDVIPEKNLLKEFNVASLNNRNLISLGLRDDLLDFDHWYLTEDTIEHYFELIKNLPAFRDIRTTVKNYNKRTGKGWRGNWQMMFSHCFCIWKEVFEKVGGFDENFVHWGGEDVELGYRLYKIDCKIELNENVHVYHIHHDYNFSSNILSLKKNYQLFLNKHNSWEVELFVREFECWPIQTIEYQEAIYSRKHLISRINNSIKILDYLPPKTVLAGIEDEILLSSPCVVKSFNPRSQSFSDKNSDRMGIFLSDKNNSYDLVLLSVEYRNINEALFTMIFKEMSRIARRVVLVENEEIGIAEKIRDVFRTSFRAKRFLTFTMENDIHISPNRFWFINLAMASNKLGIHTGLELGYDPYKQADLNIGFLHFAGQNRKLVINRIYSSRNNFMGDQVPCFMDSVVATCSSRAVGQRIFWEDTGFINQERYYLKHKLGMYNRLYYRRELEQDFYPDFQQRNYLPVGIDSELLEECAHGVFSEKGQFIFVWAEPFSSPYVNLDLLLEIFSELFADNSKVILKIMTPSNFRHVLDNEHNTPVLEYMDRNSIEYFHLSHGRYLMEQIDRYKQLSNIHFLDDDFCLEYAVKLLAASDCFIDISSTRYLHPLVLQSIALGKKCVIPDDNRYDGYLSPHSIYRVDGTLISALNGFGSLEGPVLKNQDPRRYFLVYKPDRNSLREALLKAFGNKDEKEVSESFIKEYREKFNWVTIAEKLVKDLY